MRLEGKVAIITGAASGIGRQAAIIFAQEGAKIIVVDINKEGGRETVDTIKRKGGKAIFLEGDVAKAKDAKMIVDKSIKSFGRVDILFNNAGIDPYGSVTESTDKDWERCIDVNLNSIRLLSKYAIPFMIKQGGGSIINTASIAAFSALSNQAAYCASKGGVVALTKAMAVDHASENIRVNAVCPGVTDTKQTRNAIERLPNGEEYRKAILRGIPLHRLAKPEEIAYAALYLASDESSFTTGATLVVDGGHTAYCVPI